MSAPFRQPQEGQAFLLVGDGIRLVEDRGQPAHRVYVREASARPALYDNRPSTVATVDLPRRRIVLMVADVFCPPEMSDEQVAAALAPLIGGGP